MAPVGVAGGVGVVLEDVDLALHALFGEALLGVGDEALEDALPALSWTTSWRTWSHSGVAYSGCEPTSRYSRDPLERKTLEDRPHDTTLRNRYRATSSGVRRR